ncbi:hypothetical protein HNP77_001015 [Treponema rectale]|uniref:Uncharacterized protein n=1 Tax=Treponema rectale TaxID=744512 RepID=A0A840SFE6_9SPIR|nr:hypothetical protein [Treponema rectale]MBB5218646.1 hypothetical protein [Treponema rectale]
MKKLLLILSVYAVISFIAIVLLTVFLINPPELLAEDLSAYKFQTGLHNYLVMLPAILLSGFLMACSVQWQHKTSNSKERFSQGMFIRYRNCMVIGLFVVLVLFLNKEVFLFNLENSLEVKRKAPSELSEAIHTARYFINEQQYHLAVQYAQKAVIVSPGSKEAAAVLKESSDLLEIEINSEHSADEIFHRVIGTQKPVHTQDADRSPYELVQKAQDAMNRKEWFEAHYWAELAVESCDEKNTNREAAIILANDSWNKLQHSEAYENEDERNYYFKKKEGYVALNSGDNLKAYYIYKNLLDAKNVKPTPDVKRFFELAKENVESEYFFFDETEHMNRLANRHDIYFSLTEDDGTKNVIFIRNSMDIKKNGGLVRYLEGFNLVKYRQDGTFMYSVKVPFAKVMAFPSADIGGKKWKNVPYVILQSVDRNTEGLVCRPEYSFIEDDVSDISEYQNSVSEEEQARISRINSMILPMNFDDFAAISEASAGPSQMPLLALMSFISKATQYGFSVETFYQCVVSRLMYPMFILIVLLFLAAMGWNYRIEDKTSTFRFKWMFFLPLCTGVFFGIFELTEYVSGILNYVIVGLFGSASVVMAAVCYIIMLFCASVLFVSRKE